MESHFTNPFWGRELERILGEAAQRKVRGNSNLLVCPHWTAKSAPKARKLINRCAKELKWSPELNWVLHSTRDGAAVDAFLKAAGKSEKQLLLDIQRRTGHVTLDMLRHYAVPNEERLEFQRMKVDDAMLRATGVVVDHVERRFHGGRRVGGLVGVSPVPKATGLISVLKKAAETKRKSKYYKPA